MTDPIRDWHRSRQPGGYTLPDTPPAPSPPVAAESLTPGTGRPETTTENDVFRQMLNDSLDGMYGA